MRSDHTITQEYVRLSRRRPVRAQAVPGQPDYPPHDHEFYEICLVTGGSARHLTEDGETSLSLGSVVVMAPGQVHGFARGRGFSVINVYYLSEWFLAGAAPGGMDRMLPLFFERALFPSPRKDGVKHFKLPPDEIEACLNDFVEMEALGEAPDIDTDYLEIAFLKCLLRLTRAWEREERTRPGSRPLPSSIRRGLARLEITARRGEALDVAATAREAGASLSYFCRQFRAHTGLTPGEYFQRRRIHRACRRLLDTDDDVTEVAHALGYSDCPHFIRHFRRVIGLTPGAYRRKFTEDHGPGAIPTPPRA